MSFKRLEPEDFIISTDSIVAGAFNGSNGASGAQINSGLSDEYFAAYGADGIANYFTTIEGARRTDPNTDITKANTIYHQFANIIQGDTDLVSEGGKGGIPGFLSAFTAVVIDRSKFKQGIFPNTFKIGSEVPDTSSVNFTNAGREFEGESSGYKLYPDCGFAIVNTGTVAGKAQVTMEVDSEEIITSNYVFVRARNAEFNYSQNPTFINKTTGGVRYSEFITAPQTFITTVGLYNDNGDCLAVAKLSRPLKKDFTKEALIRIKLDF